MRILLTNDDGISATGLQKLFSRLADGFEIVVVAPDQQRSQCGHSVSTGKLQVNRIGDNQFTTTGTPVDCVRLGLLHICDEVDIVISGINHGANLGADLWMSGTVAAAREAFFRGKTGIAVSRYHRPDTDADWDAAADFAAELIETLLNQPQPSLWNINLPACGLSPDRVRHCPVDSQGLPVEIIKTEDGHFVFGGSYHDRPRTEDHDVALCFGGYTTISRLEG